MRYRKYFLNHLLWLDDGFCQYYLQNPTWIPDEILDVETVAFSWPDEAEQWLAQCAEHDPETTFRNLRTFLADHCQEDYTLHRMNNRQVLKAAARQISQNMHKIVIEPKLGWAVQVDPLTEEPLLPIAAEPETEFGQLLAELKIELDAMVAEQQKKFDQYEVQLAGLTDSQKKALYSSKARKGLIDNQVKGVLETIKGLPGLYWSLLKKEMKIITKPARLTLSALRSLVTLDMEPLNQEIYETVRPFTETREQAIEISSMLYILLGNEETYSLLYNFAEGYWKATHPLEKIEIAAENFADIALKIIIGLCTIGVGAAAAIMIKSRRLAKAGNLLQEIHKWLKRTRSGRKVPDKEIDGQDVLSGGQNSTSRTRNRKPDSVDDKVNEGYSGNDGNGRGPKTAEAPEEIIRRDNNPYDPSGRSGKKSYIDKDGDLVPANPKGKATVEQHIRGAEPAKSDSPYTSFSADANTPKSYGNKKITVDSKRLKKDIDSGKLKDVEIVDQDKIGDKLQKKIDQAQEKYDSNPSKKNSKLLERRKMDLKNTQRDKEILIKGKVPKKYIKVTTD